mmetsp:Transcript_5959/g.6649  ORF Transcript_5959/g.6649 Transcript_5959/m.6649 type:complete len:94 (+) Transcript_5959:142-423(+)|eukprot:CAMPEP_0171010726 /NCGR_PEP_ID=MMETSP0736-20130129/22303_1 /TAXON_ID=186038 /ORGANISM="Fragilariopsis kerguelensis, Strain L26-C5" /LENGTH=93 /DNA_ID=CAMNT_0011443015 /DNA_START=97 /DNA_END=378 /DNA_ORIENTATION=+
MISPLEAMKDIVPETTGVGDSTGSEAVTGASSYTGAGCAGTSLVAMVTGAAVGIEAIGTTVETGSAETTGSDVITSSSRVHPREHPLTKSVTF